MEFLRSDSGHGSDYLLKYRDFVPYRDLYMKIGKNACEAEFATKIGPVEVPDRLHTCCGVHTWTYEHFKTRNDFFGFFFKKL